MAVNEETRKEILEEIRYVTAILQRTPTQREFTIHSRKFKGGYVTANFGSWNKALHKAGLRPTRIRLGSLNRESLIEKIKQLAKEIGRTPTQKDFNNTKDFPSSGQVRRCFGNWTQAIIAADLRPTRWEKTAGNRRQIILDWIQDFSAKHGRRPTVYDLQRSKDAPSHGVVIHLFGSHNKALIAAGFDPRKPGQNTSYIPDDEQKQIIIRWIQEFHTIKGYVPRNVDIQISQVKGISHHAVERLFGSVANAITLAGLQPRKMGQHGIKK